MDRISIERTNGLSFEIDARHRRVMSSPAEEGPDAGLTPAELFAGSLGACIAMDVQRYCDELDCGEGDVEVNLAFQVLGRPQRIGAIGIDLKVPAGLPEDGQERLRQITEECVVRHTLKNPPAVDVGIKCTAN
jgi:uncharacterized OsmC-like protein